MVALHQTHDVQTRQWHQLGRRQKDLRVSRLRRECAQESHGGRKTREGYSGRQKCGRNKNQGGSRQVRQVNPLSFFSLPMHAPYIVEVPDVNYFSRQVLCREGCPVRTDSGAYVQAIAEGKYEEAYIIARTPNPFASICGRVCAAPCEAKCRRGALDAAVSIRALKRFVCEKFGVESDQFDLGRVYPELRDAHRERIGGGRKVAVVGGGPAGLSCAHELALWGFSPTVFEACNLAGGMLVLGVPEYRLPREIIRAEIEAIESLGVEIRLNSRLGRDFTLSSLKQQGYEAVFLGIGAHKSRELAIEGVQFDGVLRAIEFLLNVNLGYRVTLGRKVVVIGGGNVA